MPLSSPTPKASHEVARKKTKKKIRSVQIRLLIKVICIVYIVDDGGIIFPGS